MNKQHQNTNGSPPKIIIRRQHFRLRWAAIDQIETCRSKIIKQNDNELQLFDIYHVWVHRPYVKEELKILRCYESYPTFKRGDNYLPGVDKTDIEFS